MSTTCKPIERCFISRGLEIPSIVLSFSQAFSFLFIFSAQGYVMSPILTSKRYNLTIDRTLTRNNIQG